LPQSSLFMVGKAQKSHRARSELNSESGLEKVNRGNPIRTSVTATGWMIGGSSPGRGWEFFPSPQRPDRLWGPPNILSNGYGELFPRG